jgi:hypothetical protein
MFGSNSNDDTTQSDQGQTTAPSFDGDSTDQVGMTSEAPSYLPSVPSTSDDSAAPSDEAAALDSLVSATDEPADTSAKDAPAPSSSPSPAPASDDLLKLKQQALQQLTPLVGHLEQSAEDRFRTFMMMIQASDDKSLITSAYEAAQEIEDEKVRAQALLDVVNEINYFTQQEQSPNQD